MAIKQDPKPILLLVKAAYFLGTSSSSKYVRPAYCGQRHTITPGPGLEIFVAPQICSLQLCSSLRLHVFIAISLPASAVHITVAPLVRVNYGFSAILVGYLVAFSGPLVRSCSRRHHLNLHLGPYYHLYSQRSIQSSINRSQRCLLVPSFCRYRLTATSTAKTNLYRGIMVAYLVSFSTLPFCSPFWRALING